MRQELAVPGPPPDETHRNLSDLLFAHGPGRQADPLLSVRSTGGWDTLSVGQVTSRVRELAAGLIAAGIQPGERVAIMSRTRLEWTLCDFAVFAVAGVVVPIYETSSADQIEWILSDSGAVALFAETDLHVATVDKLRVELPELRHVWGIDAGALDEVTALGRDTDQAEVDRRRALADRATLASIIYTSGTTGRPKGCELTHGNGLAGLDTLVPHLPQLFASGGSTVLFLPLAHIFGRAIEFACIGTVTRMGYCSDTTELADHLRTFQPTFILAVPRVFEKVYNTAKQQAHATGRGGFFDAAEHTAIAYSKALAQGRPGLLLKARHAVFDQLVYARLRAAVGGRVAWAVSGGGPLGARLGHFFRGVGITVLEVYGLTETIGSSMNFADAIKIGSVGRPVPGSAVGIADDGEILTMGPCVFNGYWHNPAATEEAFETVDGKRWFHTGDIGELDSDGYLTITGRKKELIVTASGKNVAPAVLEDRIRADRLVSQCMVVGDKRPYVACLVTVDEEAWPAWAADHAVTGSIADNVDDPAVRGEIQHAIDDANQAVSHAEAIKRFTVLPKDFTEERGEITPTLKLKRDVIAADYSAEIEALYA